MASPPPSFSGAGSPPNSANATLPSKKRGSGAADLTVPPPNVKRRKPSVMSATSASSLHPLRQTSFPPDESQNGAFSPSFRRSPSVDTMSLVSGSQVSAAPPKKKRGRKSKAERAAEAEASARAQANSGGGSAADGSGGKAGGKDDDADGGRDADGEGQDVPENMASKAAVRSKEQIREEDRMRAMLVQHMDHMQFFRYEFWHGATLRVSDVKRHINSVTSQSCPITVQQMMQVVCKMYLGDIVEEARRVQAEWTAAGESQQPEAETSNDSRSSSDNENDDENENENEKEKEKELSELSRYRRQAPLRPDHLREAYRRRHASAEGGGAMGSLQHWNHQTQNGTERFSHRAGGRRVFR